MGSEDFPFFFRCFLFFFVFSPILLGQEQKTAIHWEKFKWGTSLRPRLHRPMKSGKKKAHKHKLFGPVALGKTPGMFQGQTTFVPGTKPLCLRDKPRFSPYFTQWKHSLSQGQTQFVPGTIAGTKGGRNKLCVKSLCAFFAHYESGTKAAGTVFRNQNRNPAILFQ